MIIVTATGTDNVTIKSDPEHPWKIWLIDEIFQGNEARGKYIPNENDLVYFPTTNTMQKVYDVDTITGISTIDVIKVDDQRDNLLYDQPLGYRVFVDDGVTPSVMTVDRRYRLAGSLASYVIIYRELDQGGLGDVVGELYSPDGTFLGNKIPLELVLSDSHTNHTVKQVIACSTTRDIPDGEVLIVVAYDINDNIISRERLLAIKTNFVNPITIEDRVITDIILSSPFYDPVNGVINRPTTLPVNELGLVPSLVYDDGSVVPLPITDDHISIFGLDIVSLDATNIDYDIVLGYTLKQGETAGGNLSVNGDFITRSYVVRNYIPEGKFQYRLHVYPVKVNGEYTLRVYLISGERAAIYDVTEHITTSVALNPTLFTLKQNISVAVNVSVAERVFGDFVYHQTVGILLRTPDVTIDNSPWRVSNGDEEYNVFRTTGGSGDININGNETVFEVWRDKLLSSTNPLLIEPIEDSVLTPTHVKITVRGNAPIVIPVSQWDTPITLDSPILGGDDVLISFIQIAGNKEFFINAVLAIHS